MIVRNSTKIERVDSILCGVSVDKEDVVVTGDEGGHMRLWDINRKKVVKSYPSSHKGIRMSILIKRIDAIRRMALTSD